MSDPKRTFLLRIAGVWDRVAEYKSQKSVAEDQADGVAGFIGAGLIREMAECPLTKTCLRRMEEPTLAKFVTEVLPKLTRPK